MTTKVKPSQVSREAVALTATVRNGAVAPRAKSAQVVPLKPHNYSSAKSQNDALFAPASTARTAGLAYEAAKRVFDFVLGLILLIIATPIILLAAAAIRVETKGSPFFIQTRLGKGGKPFKIVKLRGMFIDARTRFASYYDYSNQGLGVLLSTTKIDPRVTRAGRFIRRTSIDELPNLWNVVLGDMSLVGTRVPKFLKFLPYTALIGRSISRSSLALRVFPNVREGIGSPRKKPSNLIWTTYASAASDWTLRYLWKTFRGVVLRRDVF
jgi:lipopolysaccharide/colanic/teichoic acid biosynthesis glycosyltransferase